MKTLTIQEVAARVGLHPKTVNRMIHEGRFLRPMAFCGRARWDAAVFEEWLRSQHNLAEVGHATAK
jgi:excisionase family DNA binding protein